MHHAATTRRRRSTAWLIGLACAVLALSACGSGAGDAAGSSRVATTSSARPAASTTAMASASAPSTSQQHTPSAVHPTHRTTTHRRSATDHSSTAAPETQAVHSSGAHPNGSGPVIVVDPGHSRTIHATDPNTGLNVSEYENEPEMRDVFDVAELVVAQLRDAGYRVILTKPTLNHRITLAQRAAIANDAHAALALSIHDQAGADGGIGFDTGNNIVYYQSVGTYRQNPAGKKIVFTDRHVAALSKKYGKIFQRQRARSQGTSVRLQGDVGYNLGSRGLAPGNIWTVQLLARVPWIYNEAGGNSSGMVGLNTADKRTYAAGLVAAVERCIPLSQP